MFSGGSVLCGAESVSGVDAPILKRWRRTRLGRVGVPANDFHEGAFRGVLLGISRAVSRGQRHWTRAILAVTPALLIDT